MLSRFAQLFLLTLLPRVLSAQAIPADTLKAWLGQCAKLMERGDFKKGAEIALNCIEIANKNGTTGIVGRAYYCLAGGALGMRDYQKSMEYARASLRANLRESNTEGIGDAHLVASIIWLANNQLDSALASAQAARQIFRQAGKTNTEAVALTKIGHVFNIRGEYAKATPYYLESYEMTRPDSLSNAFMNANLCLASNYIYLKQYDKALFHAQKCLDVAEAHNSFYEKNTALDYLSSIYEKKGDPRKALEFYRKHAAVRDSILSESRTRQVKELEIKYEAAERQNEIRLLEKEKSRQRAVIWAVLVSLVLLAAAAFRIWQFYKQRTRDNQILTADKAQTEERLEAEHQKLEQLTEIEAFKSRFFTNITHEFRTPLTVILGMAEQVKSEIGNSATSNFQSLISKVNLIKRNGENLLRLVNQILDLAKLESNSLKINYIHGDVLAYLRYVAESLHSLANAQNVLVKVESDQAKIEMDYDPERLLQIAHNLLSNAIKFTTSGGRVVLRLQILESSHPQILIEVADTGAGIPPEDLPRIFDRFFQANNLEKAKAGGTGIGLSLTKELVKAMGGEISAESPDPRSGGKGATFKVVLPIRHEAPESTENQFVAPFAAHGSLATNSASPQPENPASTVPAGPLPQILIIEDNPDVVEYLAACLSEHYRLDFAYNGRAGIEKATELVPDLIVSDVMMPERNGFEVCDFLKNDERTSHIPIMLLTAKADVESRIAGLRRGADAYLAKPFNPEELTVTLGKMLENRARVQAFYGRQILENVPLQNLEAPKPEAPDLENEFLQKLRSAVEAHLGEDDLSSEKICREMGMGKSNLYAKLSALTGLSFNIYVRKLRLARARALLSEGSLNVSEAAFAVGFTDPGYFSRVFAEEFGFRPSEVRKL